MGRCLIVNLSECAEWGMEGHVTSRVCATAPGSTRGLNPRGCGRGQVHAAPPWERFGRAATRALMRRAWGAVRAWNWVASPRCKEISSI